MSGSRWYYLVSYRSLINVNNFKNCGSRNIFRDDSPVSKFSVLMLLDLQSDQYIMTFIQQIVYLVFFLKKTGSVCSEISKKLNQVLISKTRFCPVEILNKYT